MASWQARLTAWVVRRRVKPRLGDMQDIQRVRRVFNTSLPSPRGVRYTPATLGGVPGEWVTAHTAAGPSQAVAGGHSTHTTLLYLHGGGFVGCSPQTHRPLTAALAKQGLRVFVPDYRLAPEHPYPAALDDTRAVWHALCADPTVAPGRLVVAGDSAGGNLALALMLAERAAGGRLPDAAALFSPATDLSGGSPSVTANAQRDAMFAGEALGALADAYLQGADPTQPLVSPLLGELHGLPPLLLHVGENECLRDDSLRLAVKARAAGVRVVLQVWPVVPHVWQLLQHLPEARQSVRQAADFLRHAEPAPQAAGAQRATARSATGAPEGTAAAPAPVDEALDVLIVGAGLSGIGMAARLQRQCPDQRYAILEGRPVLGGTWDLFRYPGVRSDSDMYTLGYASRPWTDGQALADGPAIRRYIEDTARDHGLDAQIRYGHRVLSADWSSASACWTVTVALVPPTATDAQPPDPASLPQRRFSARFLLMCSGYYRYDRGHRPSFADEALFQGRLVHPQFWPADLDCTGRQVVVIGSGATAVTLVPELAKTAAQVTMLQRSPTYVATLPRQDPLARRLRGKLPAMLAYRLVRLKAITLGMLLFGAARRWPQATRQRILGLARQQLGPAGAPGGAADVARHFNPRYDPWDQRVCAVPDGDLFKALRGDHAAVVTDEITRFTPTGVALASGRTLPADIIITATGLELQLAGGVALAVDGVPVQPAETMSYKGMMFTGVPNLISVTGYTNASWTLKADLTAAYACRLIRHLQRHQLASATPQADPTARPLPFLDFRSGYVQRALDRLPRQGHKRPWRLYQNYLLDLITLRCGRLADGHLLLAPAPAPRAAAQAPSPLSRATPNTPNTPGEDRCAIT